MRKDTVALVDVRSPKEFTAMPKANAIARIPYNQAPFKLIAIVTYCGLNP